MAILDSLSLSLPSTGSDPYKAVMNVWISGLLFMESIVKGVPQTFGRGEALLALSAWHLYPEVTVLTATEAQTLTQNDTLLPTAGAVTLDIKCSTSEGTNFGITWSLPLSHLRYYGQAVVTKGSLDGRSRQVTMEELLFVTLGCITNEMGNESGEFQLYLRFLVVFSTFLTRHGKADQFPWAGLLGDAGQQYLNLQGDAREKAFEFIQFGRRQCPTFLSDCNSSSSSPPKIIPRGFGLLQAEAFLGVIKEDPEDRIRWLRNHFQNYPKDTNTSEVTRGLIRYTPPGGGGRCGPREPEYATLFPTNGTNSKNSRYHRWTPALDSGENASKHRNSSDTPDNFTPVSTTAVKRMRELEAATNESCALFLDSDVIIISPANISKSRPPGQLSQLRWKGRSPFGKDMALSMPIFGASLRPRQLQQQHLPETKRREVAGPGPLSISSWATTTRQHFFSTRNKSIRKAPSISLDAEAQRLCKVIIRELAIAAATESRPPDDGLNQSNLPPPPTMTTFGSVQQPHRCWYISKSRPSEDHTFSALLGAAKNCSVFFPPNKSKSLDEFLHVPLDEAIQCLECDVVDADALGRHLVHVMQSYPQPFASLNALDMARKLYNQIPGDLVQLSVTARPIHQYRWTTFTSSSMTSISPAAMFACIATFATGYLDVDPLSLKDVMCISTGNSLYASHFLCTDPYESLSSPAAGVRRYVGSVGRPGLSFLVSPKNPHVVDMDYADWQLVLHDEFDGQFKSSFNETWMHIRITGYERAVNSGEHGLYDDEAYYRQAIVQVYDSGSWVADIDVASIFYKTTAVESQQLRRLFVEAGGRCGHSPETRRDFSRGGGCAGRITSIDSWPELLDLPPQGVCVIRANRNPMARIAATVVAVQKLRRVVVATEDVCWQCIREYHKEEEVVLIV